MSESPSPLRSLGPFDAGCVVVGAIIGVGIFFTPSKVASLVPSPALALAAWGLAGMLALAGALAFAEIGRRRTGQAAQYHALREAFGPLTGFLFVFCNATAVQTGAIGIIAVICAANLGAIVTPEPLSLSWSMGLACGLIGLVTLANLAGVRWGSRVQNLTVIAKVGALAAIAALAAFAPRQSAADHSTPAAALSPIAGLLAALVPAFFAYGGWQHALWISGEIREPARNLPRAILLGTLTVVVVYVGANAAYLSLLGHGGVAASKALAADAVAIAFPETGRRFVAAAVALSAFGVLNAQLLSGPRLIAGMADDGRFFPAFSRRSARQVPAPAILLLSIAAVLLLAAVGANGIDRLLTGVVVIDGVFFAATAFALFRLPTAGRSLPFAKIAAGIFIVGELALLTGSTLDPATRSASIIGLAWIAAAALLYAAAFRDNARWSPGAVLTLTTALVFCWYAMQIIHELGHVLAALATGGSVAAVHLPLVGFSRTDAASDAPRWLVLGGPIFGSLAPIAALLALRWLGRGQHTLPLAGALAGFCLLANGVYLASAIVDPVGDAQDLVRLGVPPAALWIPGIAASMLGVFMLRAAAPAFGFAPAIGRERPEPHPSLSRVSVIALGVVGLVVIATNLVGHYYSPG
jgi:APA family basic amino acid/polyamine antiporter